MMEGNCGGVNQGDGAFGAVDDIHKGVRELCVCVCVCVA